MKRILILLCISISHALAQPNSLDSDAAKAAAAVADVDGPEIKKSVTVPREYSDPFQITMSVEKTQISFYGAPVVTQREGEDNDAFWKRYHEAVNVYEISAFMDRDEVAAFAASLEKVVAWADIAARNKVQDFEKSFTDAAGRDWKFQCEKGEVSVLGEMGSFQLYQVKMMLSLLAQLPEADKELTAKAATISRQDQLFK